jgi:hypothetical protein
MSDDVNRSSSLVTNDKLLGTKVVYIAHNLYLVAETHLLNRRKNIEGVKVGTIFTKWGNSDENLLNGVIAVKIVKLGGKTGIYSFYQEKILISYYFNDFNTLVIYIYSSG